MSQVIYSANGIEVDASRITTHNTLVLLGRAVGHIMSNEVPKEIRADAEAALAWRQGKIDLLYNGELGVRAKGEPKPSTDPVDVIARELAEAAIRKAVANRGWKIVRAKKDADGNSPGLVIVQADGTLVKPLRASIESRLGHPEHGPKLFDAAKVEHARRTKAAEKVGVADADDEI